MPTNMREKSYCDKTKPAPPLPTLSMTMSESETRVPVPERAAMCKPASAASLYILVTARAAVLECSVKAQ
eukprot:6186253-Pleurochrysis_carterae.AAC.1